MKRVHPHYTQEVNEPDIEVSVKYSLLIWTFYFLVSPHLLSCKSGRHCALSICWYALPV